MKKEHPILFSTPMVQALLNGSKTMTRRIVKPQPSENIKWDSFGYSALTPEWHIEGRGHFTEGYGSKFFKCPYGQVGDVLWVRESFAPFKAVFTQPPSFHYKANTSGAKMKWKPSIHMPKVAARIWLEITEIKIERLQDISSADAVSEGISPLLMSRMQMVEMGGQKYRDYECKDLFSNPLSPITSFMTLWKSINGTESWDADPWVWVIKFKKIKK